MDNSRLDELIKRSQIKGESDAAFPGVDFLNVNMFVEAGAGAGKTTLIVQRIVNQLKAGDEPGAFVVITFTNAAAEELRERITAKVKAEGLTEALEHLDEMNISTIHSFCNVLLKEQSILAGLPQGMELMEPEQSRELQIKYLNEYLSTLTTAEWDDIERDAKEGESRWRIRQDIQELYSQIVDLPKDTVIITPRNVASGRQVLADRVKIVTEIYAEMFRCAQSLLNPAAADSKKVIFTTMQDFRDDPKLPSTKAVSLLDAYYNNSTDHDKVADEALRILLKERGSIFKGSGLTVAYLKEDVPAVNEELNRFIDERIGALREMLPGEIDDSLSFVANLQEGQKKEAHYQCLLEYAKKAREYYYAHKPVSLVSNDNLLEITRDLICNEDDTRALEFFAQKYKHFYVDEFQDTDRIQEAFIYRLASDLADKDHIKLRDGALFVVGDPKQSIYRFRGAQPQVYFDVKNRMADAAMKNTYVYELSSNFRSNDEVIGWVNDMFVTSDSVMPIVNPAHPYKPMASIKKVFASAGADYTMPDGEKYDPDKLLHGIYKHERCDATYTGKVRKKVKDQYVAEDGLIYNDEEYSNEDDIEAVVNLILNIKNQKYMITRYDENNNFAPYPDYVSFKDFLLVPYDTTQMERYLKVLKSYGIPVRFDGKAKLNTDKILNTYTRLYWYIVNPKEPFHRMAAKEAIRESNLVVDFNELEEYADYLLDTLYYGARELSAFGKAVYLENQISALFEKNIVYDVIDVYAAKTRLRQMIEMVLNGATGTGIQLAQAFDSYVDSSIEHELSLESGADAVRFMNLHKTKGLEGEIVIFLDRRGYRDSGITSLKDGASFYPGIKSWSSVSGIQLYVDKNKKEEEAEFHRLEYVAVTRAKQAVIFMNVISHNGIFATSSTKMAPKSHPTRNGMEDKGFNYHIDSLPNSVKPIIDSCSNAINSPVSNGNYDLAQDGYNLCEGASAVHDSAIEGASAAGSSCLEGAFFEKINPSALEKKHSSIKGRCIYSNKTRLEKIIVDEVTGKTEFDVQEEIFDRPFGAVLGTVLHRAMELIVDRFDEGIADETAIRKLTDFCSRQAVRESEYDIPASDCADDYFEYVRKTAFAFYRWIKESRFLEGVKSTFTEIPFSYYTAEDNTWMKGTADLIVEYEDGSVKLIDYKSDNDFLVDEPVMSEGFCEKYAPQLAVYKGIAKRMFKVSDDMITTGIISFSLKDENGKKLPGDEMRVRLTNL